MKTFLLLCLALLSGCGSYYVKVVDQHGNPIPGAGMTYSTLDGNAYLNDREGHEAVTDSQGMARLVAGQKNSFYEMRKEGYQFDLRRQMLTKYKGSLDGRSLSAHHRGNPLIIEGWKRGAEPDLTIVKGSLKVVNDGSPCAVQVLSEGGRSLKMIIKNRLMWKEETREEALRIAPNRRYFLESWSSRLSVAGAQIKETDDIFMHEADANGYKALVEVKDDDRDHTYELYVRGEGGWVYGGGIVQYREASTRTKTSADEATSGWIDFQFWFNAKGSRSIMRDRDAAWGSPGLARGGKTFRCEKDL